MSKELEQLILSKSRPVQKEVKQLQKSELDRLITEALLGEAQGRGVQLEWAIVYWALKAAGKEEELNERIKQFPQLQEYGEGIMKDDAQKAVKVAKKAGAPIEQASHSDEIGIRGDPEPKTDLVFGKQRVSVKMEGPIQLTSSEGRRTAKMFKTVMEEMLQDPDLKKDLEEEVLTGIIERIEKIPTKMIDIKNLDKALLKRPKVAMEMLKDGRLLDEKNWKIWEANNKKQITQDVITFMVNNPKFHFLLIEEAMTGKRAFGESDLATSDYILTPSYYGPINQGYVQKVAAATKIQIRAKSRSGITSATMRFDVMSAAKVAASEVDQPLEEAVGDFLKNIKEKAFKFIKKWLRKFKEVITSWFEKNIDDVVSQAVDTVDIESVALS